MDWPSIYSKNPVYSVKVFRIKNSFWLNLIVLTFHVPILVLFWLCGFREMTTLEAVSNLLANATSKNEILKKFGCRVSHSTKVGCNTRNSSCLGCHTRQPNFIQASTTESCSRCCHKILFCVTFMLYFHGRFVQTSIKFCSLLLSRIVSVWPNSLSPTTPSCKHPWLCSAESLNVN